MTATVHAPDIAQYQVQVAMANGWQECKTFETYTEAKAYKDAEEKKWPLCAFQIVEVAPAATRTAYYLTLTSPVFDNRDCIRGTRTQRLEEFGTYETEAMAFLKADLLRDEWCLDLGDGDFIAVRRCDTGKPVVRPLPAWLLDDAGDIPF